MVNFLLALLIYILVFFKWGESYVPADRLEYGLMFDSAFVELGLRNGDKILALDGEKVDKWGLIHHDIVVNQPATIQIERDGKNMDLQVPEGMTASLLKAEYGIYPRLPFELVDFNDNGGAEAAGMKIGDQIIAINLTAAFHTTRTALPLMKANGWGRIINIASVHGLIASPFKSAYIAAKHGLVGLTKTVALETAEQGITCNAICPGWVKTPLVDKQIDLF